MKAALLILIASLPGCRAPRPAAKPAAAPLVEYAFMHADGKPCPALYILRPAFFTERDGTTEDACAAAPGVAAKFTLDHLGSGESFTLSIPASVQGWPVIR